MIAKAYCCFERRVGMFREPRPMRKVQAVRGEKLPVQNAYLFVLN